MRSNRMEATGTEPSDKTDCRCSRLRPLVIIVALVVSITILVLHGSDDCFGDVIVTDALDVTDTNWTLFENVTVRAGGSLHVSGSAVTFLSEWPLQHGIVVETGGELVVTDLDDDPGTTADRSVLDGNMPFFLIARPGSRLAIDNSLVSRCGGEPFRPYIGSAGVELMGSDFSIRDTDFRNSTAGLYLNATSGGRVSGCTFSGMSYGIRGTMVGAVSIEDCLFEDLDWGFVILRDPGASGEVLGLDGCRFQSMGTYAVWISGPRLVHVRDCRFEDCNTAIYLNGISEDAVDVTVSSNAFSGGFCCIELVGLTGVQIWNNDLTEFTIAIQARSGTNTMTGMNVSGNTFHDGGTSITLGYGKGLTIAGNSFADVRVGVSPQSRGVLIVGNVFEGVSNAGVFYQGEGAVEVLANRFLNCSYGLKVQHDGILYPGLQLVNNTFAGNYVGALLRDVEPLVLEGNGWEGDGTGLSVIGSELDVHGDVSVDGCGVGIRLSAVRGLLQGVSVTNCSIGVTADLGTVVTLEGCDLTDCDLDVTAANYSTVVLLDSMHGGSFAPIDQWSEVRLEWTCTLELVHASDGSPAPNVPCELVTASASSQGRFPSDIDGRVGPRRIVQARYTLEGAQIYTPYTVNVEFNGNVHPFCVTFRDVHIFVLVLDDVPPVLEVVEPVDGASLNNTTVHFSISMDDANSAVAILAVHVDGEVLRTLSDPGPYVEFDEPIGDGSHTVLVSLLDTWGNERESTLALAVDTIAPDVTLTSPEDMTLTNLTEILVEGSVGDAVGAELSGRPIDLGGEGTFSMTIALVDEGDNDIILAAWDSVGNFATTRVVVVRDTRAPRIVLEPFPALTREVRLTVSGWTDGHDLQANGEEVTLGSEGCFTHEVMLLDGDNSITLMATDPAGNSAMETLVCTRDSILVFDIMSPENGASIDNASVTAEGTGEEGLRFRLEGVPDWTLVGPSGGFQVDLELPRFGTNVFVFTLEDEAGNQGTFVYSLNRTGRTMRTRDDGTWWLYIALLATGLAIIVAILALRRAGEER